MQELITKDYNGFAIEFELIDGQLMANATSMCAAFDKRPADWLKTATAKRFIEAKGKKIVLTESQMICVRNGGNDNGTWLHESLVRKLAEWLDTDFEVQCDEWLTELLRTGKVEIRQLSPAELILAQAQQLVDHERRMHVVETKQQVLEGQQLETRREVLQLGEQVAEVAAKQTTSESGYYAVRAFAKLLGRRMPKEDAADFGKRATAMSKRLGIKVSKVKDERWGTVNSYHEDVLGLVFGAKPARLAA